MKRLRAYKTEVDPNDVQRTAFLQHAGAARFAYNWALADRLATYAATGKSGNLYEQLRRFNALKDEQFPWIRQVAYRTVAGAFRNLDTAFSNFFRHIKSGEPPGFPKFKSRKRGVGSFRLQGSLHIESDRVKMPRIGWVRLKERDYLPTDVVKLLAFTISESAGRWFISAQVEEEAPEPERVEGEAIGVDFGINALCACSNGKVFENPKALSGAERELGRLQRELARRVKGSKNRGKTRLKLARCHMRVANIRKHTLHQVSDYLTAKVKPSAIALEDLNVKGMLANHHLARSISDVSFSELRRQLVYKCEWQGIELVVVDRFYPSSKTCSACGSVKPLLKLSERTFVCEHCGLVLDRDLNAARNLASLAVKPTVSACGVGMLEDATVKQEPGSVLSVSPGGNW